MLIKILDERAREWYENHTEFHVGDSGLDLFTLEEVSIQPMGTGKLTFGIAVEALDDDGNPTSFWMLPRSSIVKTPLRMANSIGLIDAGYRGPLMAFVDNFTSTTNVYNVDTKTRLFQIASPTLEPITFEIVDELSETTRGEGGFGSTGQ